jgi:hypothetical protein
VNFAKQAALVGGLFKKTAAGQLEWKPSVGDDQFQVSFRNYTVRIELMAGRQGPDYVIQVINENGNIADSFSDNDIKNEEGAPLGQSWFGIMRELHLMARRSALGADKALDALLKEIDEDEIPF